MFKNILKKSITNKILVILDIYFCVFLIEVWTTNMCLYFFPTLLILVYLFFFTKNLNNKILVNVNIKY